MLYDKLKRYAAGDVYPFHMPGHKRQLSGDFPYALDLTEIEGFDYLHDPQGCIRAVEHKAEALYGAARAFLLVNGATGGMLAAVRAMTKRGDKVIMARNCHTSVYHAAELCGLEPVYVLPDVIEGTDIYGSVRPAVVERLLLQHPDAKLVILTSPTYEGVCSDIGTLSQMCHMHGAKLLVDEAHGAHFPFDEAFPQPAVNSGADVSVVSLHKTLPSPTQTALLLANDAALAPVLQRQLAVFETSSPSYVLMSGIERCLDFVQNTSFKEYTSRLKRFYEQATSLQRLSLLFAPEDNDRRDIFDFDIGKLVITAYGLDITGRELADILRERYHIETEMSSAHYVIAMTSVCDTDEGFERLLRALSEIDKAVQNFEKEIKCAVPTELPPRAFLPGEAEAYAAEVIPLESAAGRVSLEYVYAYPPGIPLLVPGETVSAATIAAVQGLAEQGVLVTSSGKHLPEMISVGSFTKR